MQIAVLLVNGRTYAPVVCLTQGILLVESQAVLDRIRGLALREGNETRF